MLSLSPEVYSAVSVALRWLFVFFALTILFFALSWHRADRKARRERIKNLPGAGTVGELTVLSGGRDLPAETWFPVPREGVLGSLRSCDLVVPCRGVRSQHLDFSWQDGAGLMIRPRAGCEVLIDGVPVSRRGAYADAPLLHGSVLQVGSAVLQLQLFSALSHTNKPFVPQAPSPAPGSEAWMMPVMPPVQDPSAVYQSWPDQAVPVSPVPGQPLPVPPEPGQPLPDASLPGREEVPPDAGESQPEQQAAPRRKRADRWKEDWSE